MASIYDLGPYYGIFANVTGVNSSAEAVGQSNPNTSSTTCQAVLVDSNHIHHAVGPLPGYKESFANGVNDSAQVVGYSQNPAGGFYVPIEAFLYNQGTLTDLGTLGGDISDATSINAAGTVVGYSNTKKGNALPQEPFLWTANGGMRALQSLNGANYSAALGINGNGDVVGYSGTEGNEISTSAVLWSGGGAPQNLGKLPGGGTSEATGINDADQVVGFSTVKTGPNAPNHAFLWSASSGMQDLGTLAGYTDSYATAINSSGEVVGFAVDNVPGGKPNHAFVYANGKMTDLNTLLPANSNWTLLSATAINDNGVIVGLGFGGTDEGLHGYELFTPSSATTTPAPSPSPSPTPSTSSSPTSSYPLSPISTALPSPMVGPGSSQAGSLTPLPAPSPRFVTRTTLAAHPRSPRSGHLFTLVATVKVEGALEDVPAGSVTFLDGTTVLGTIPLRRGKASLTSAVLPLGRNSLQVQYNPGPGMVSSAAILLETFHPPLSSARPRHRGR